MVNEIVQIVVGASAVIDVVLGGPVTTEKNISTNLYSAILQNVKKKSHKIYIPVFHTHLQKNLITNLLFLNGSSHLAPGCKVSPPMAHRSRNVRLVCLS